MTPFVGDEPRPSMRKITQQSVMLKKPAYRRSKAKYAQIERERERGTKNISIHKMQQLQNNNDQQPLKKVTKSLYIVTHLGQLPFILFT